LIESLGLREERTQVERQGLPRISITASRYVTNWIADYGQ
jgi:hypothetical protein